MWPGVRCITKAPESIDSKHLRLVAIRSCAVFSSPINPSIHREWRDLDHLLVHLWTIHSIRLGIEYGGKEGAGSLGDFARILLPEAVSRGFVKVIGCQNFRGWDRAATLLET